MTRREMFRQCRDGAVQNLPRLLGMAGGVWGALGRQLEPQETLADRERPACFPPARATGDVATTSDSAGE